MNIHARVIELLRTLDDARVAWEPGAAGGGAWLMPSLYHEGSYSALERALVEMRDDPGSRKLWWHTVYRYRHGTVMWLEVRVRKTQRGPLLLMPDKHTELLAGTAVIGEQRARVKAYVWSRNVDEGLAQDGVKRLAWLMRDDPKHVTVPTVYLLRALGRPLWEERRRVAA